MKSKISLIVSFLLWCGWVCPAEDFIIKQYKYAGPLEVKQPVLADTLDVNGKGYEIKGLLKTSVSAAQVLRQAATIDADTSGTVSFAGTEGKNELFLFSFHLSSDRYVKGKLNVSGSGSFEVFVDDKPVGNSSDLTMEPRRYEVLIKYLTTESDTCPPTLKTVFTHDTIAGLASSVRLPEKYTMQKMLEGENFRDVSLSPNGKYVLIKYTNRLKDGKSESYAQLKEAATGKLLWQDRASLNTASWLPKSSRLYYTRNGNKGRELLTVDPADLRETLLADDLPKGNFRFSPDETFLLFMVEEEGPKEGSDVVRFLEPQDRLPGFRNRSFIWKYDLATGLFGRLTFGHNSTYINDISPDSRYLLFGTGERIYTSRPFSRSSLFRMDLQTMAVDTVWAGAEYVNRAVYSPDGQRLLVWGAPDAFGGIGLNIKEGQISNAYDTQLFIYDLAASRATPVTKDFDPSVSRAVWNKYDGLIYIMAEDQDYVRLFVYDPARDKMSRIDTQEDVISLYSFATDAPLMYYYGQSVSNASRLYEYNLKSKKSRLIHDLSAGKLENVALGAVRDWDFESAEGVTIQGRYYLPPDFDATRKYPVIVYFYGGTSPTSRMLEHRYSMHMYAAQGYVVYTLNPSGTTGFGQEFSSRHVNAWGKVTADEIIRGTELFCKEHPFADEKKIGCIGASYGGFMTQYLLTCTDLFATGVSHAGISALSSYWGEGYWGYAYSAVASADSYPWNNHALYIKQSPLFQADKINTPLLLLHGGADTNVPVGESIQMFNALKLLGKTVEFIKIEGEDHGIVGHEKRVKWQNSIFAWFAKWLRDEPAWWDEMYPEKTL